MNMKNVDTLIQATNVNDFVKRIREENNKLLKEILFRTNDPERTFSAKETAEMIGITYNTLMKRVRQGAIKRRESDKRFSLAEIERYKTLR
jgi:hypothetical protein